MQAAGDHRHLEVGSRQRNTAGRKAVQLANLLVLLLLLLLLLLVISLLLHCRHVAPPPPPLTEKGEEQEAAWAAAAAAATAAEAAENFWLMVGIGLLTFALFMSARMGIYQEVIYGKYGKHPKEALFYTHALPLPGFLLLAPDILNHWSICLNSAPFVLPFINLEVPSMLLYLLGNVITQYLCISSVFVLTTECASLTVTLVVTLRKFLSLLFSIWYFQNPFTLVHWFGTILVFGGTMLFSDIPGMVRAQREAAAKKKTS